MQQPRIVVSLSNPQRKADPATAEYKNRRYLEAIERHGGRALPLDERSSVAARRDAFEAMDGLLLTGGADIDPSRYGEEPAGAIDIDPGRDELDAEAFAAANQRLVPIFGICRGLQAINVFSGGRLVQHIDHHESPAYPDRTADATRHRLRLLEGSRLRTLLGDAEELDVNSFHHQAVDAVGLAPGLRASGVAPHEQGDLIEALETVDDARWVVAVQCHPEREETSPAEFERLWDAFILAAGRYGSGRQVALGRQPDPAASRSS